MIYTDASSPFDTVDRPGYRLESCLNCKETHVRHWGWACDPPSIGVDPAKFGGFHATRPERRFLTQSMKDSVITRQHIEDTLQETERAMSEAAEETPKPEWRNWAHNVPGECPCGIPLNNCEYHR